MINLSGYYTPNSIVINNTGWNGVNVAILNPVFEHCTVMSISETSKLNITLFITYSGTYKFDNYASIRIRDSDQNLLEEINDTDKDLNVLTSNFYVAGFEYGICYRNWNSTQGHTSSVPIGTNVYDFYTIEG